MWLILGEYKFIEIIKCWLSNEGIVNIRIMIWKWRKRNVFFFIFVYIDYVFWW